MESKMRNATKKRRKKQALVTYIRKDFIFYCLMCFFVFDKKKERARARERERVRGMKYIVYENLE